jgi:hypothetical protein
MEFLHHSLTNLGTLYLSFAFFLKRKLNTVDNLLNQVDTDRPFFAGFFETIEDFEAIEYLSSPVFLDHQRKGILCPLAGSKSFLAAKTFPSPPNRLLIFTEAGIDNFTLRVITKRAFHMIR